MASGIIKVLDDLSADLVKQPETFQSLSCFCGHYCGHAYQMITPMIHLYVYIYIYMFFFARTIRIPIMTWKTVANDSFEVVGFIYWGAL